MKKNLFTTGAGMFFMTILMAVVMAPANLFSQALGDEILGAARYRSIGSTRQGGRFVDFAVYEKNPSIFYAALASGGLWKTVNNGITLEPVFDNQGVICIGDVAIDQNNPDIVWVGTGEANNSRTSYYGDGIYKSVDGGKTWQNMGLRNSQHIGRIIIHPKNPNTVWVASLGPLYSENDERGVYKTTDGGKSWKRVLEITSNGKHIGVVDLAIDLSNPNILYAAAYDKVRKPWTFNNGGPGSGIYKTTDGGNKWVKLTNGLPGGMLGKIGIDVSRSNPNIVYANIENCNIDGVSDEVRYNQLLNGIPPTGREKGAEMYRSDNKGQTWRKVSPDGREIGGGPGYYYMQVRIDPKDPDHVYVVSVGMFETIDGGKEWRTPFRFGGDNHGMWINPANSKHMLLGYDHGFGVTWDGGLNWFHPDFMPVGQFVAVGFDFDYPYNVYGGLQDNGSVKGPSTKRDGGAIRLEDWKSVGGGDGMYNVVDWADSRWLYNESQFGPISRIDQKTGESKSIRYRSMDRWAWNAPIVVSPHNSKTIYHAGNKVVRSRNQGEVWEEISGDLTTQDEAKIQGTGNIQYCTIVTMEESPAKEGVLWVGTDDGKVWVTPDGGTTWNDVTANIPGHPGYWVSRVETSNADAAVAYITITGLRHDDFRPFVYKTTDYGKTWKSIASNLPKDESLCVIREHPENPNLLFVGSTKAVYVSVDAGAVWNRFRNNMPNNPVEDLKIHPRENDLIVATHGRSLFIADISYLREINNDLLAKNFHLFKVEPRVKWQRTSNNNSSTLNYAGESEPVAAQVYYYLKSDAGSVKVQVLDGVRVIFESEGPKTKGVNRVLWNYTVRPPAAAAAGAETAPRTMARAASSSARPGNYTIRLVVDGRSEEVPFHLIQDQWFDK
ncbi:MAG: hypothetical protein RBS37_04470 [Bacteroidales bacterium]|jgi:photosystem II stability/assembly factor-like uncharacterized protein|nr:hypothetical protein [Bacteroidales bacterium]